MADESAPSRLQAYDIRPVPDPTVLTTQASDRLEYTLRSLVHTEIEHRKDLTDAEFHTVDLRFRDLEARTAEQKADTTKALTDALAAQKEAVAAQTASSEKSITKSETATTERIKATEALLATSTKASDEKIDDLKSRIVAMENRGTGIAEGGALVSTRNDSFRANVAVAISLVVLLVAIVTAVILAAHNLAPSSVTVAPVVAPAATP